MHPPLAFPLPAGVLALAVLLFSLGAPRASAAVPPATNDLCASAHVIPGAGPFPYLSPLVDVLNMTTNGDPLLSRDCATNMTRSVWFTFTPATTALYSLSLGPDTGTDFGDGNNGNDSVLAIYTSAAGCAGPFTLFDCNDDAKGFTISQAAGVSTNFNSGTTYYILAWVGAISASGISNNPVKLQLRVTRPVVPANDLCSAAEVISSAGASPYFSSTIDNTLGTTNDDQIGSCIAAGQRSVWFKFTPSATGLHVISGRDSATTVGSCTIGLFQSGSGDCSSLAGISCSGDTSRGTISRSLIANTSYYIEFWDDELDYNVGETSVQLKITRAAQPIVSTLAATSITTTGATFRATVNPNGGSSTKTRSWFEWGTSTNFTSTNGAKLLPGYAGAIPATTNFSVSLTTNLTAGLTYYFRAVATNEYGASYGAAQVIVPPASPTLTPPVLLGGGAARLDFNGQPGRVHLVQASTSLPGNWTDLGTATEDTAGIYQFQTTTNAALYRFFRLRLP